ncbi:DUF3313 family protein [uncultured Brevundimonas sp.]|uniref:DUF3313 family protein n=1 Tax=uncultured Brevundimonas sp. TaxID=213418 RepID=UPI0030EEAE55|tara:strand:- start:2931 stop:3722 length:792 start_codon:yes stop_codon:yes gene_type:complete
MPRILSLLAATGLIALGACQTAPEAQSGFLQSYAGLAAPGQSLRASVLQRRDDDAAAGIERVFIAPTVLIEGAGAGLPASDLARVLREVDRQVCYEVSERFTVIAAPAADAATIRAAVVRIAATGQAGSLASATAGFFIPGPVGVRVPGATGGLAAEAELLGPDARQVAAVLWARNATVVGTDSPSLSRVGDALQLAEPFGDAVGDAFSPPDRKPRPIAQPDPCRQFGPRFSPAGLIAGFATGLYVPELSGETKPDAAQTAPD